MYTITTHTGIGVPPQLLSHPKEVVVSSVVFNTVGSHKANLVIVCNVSQTPTTTVTWFQEENEIAASFVIGLALVMNVTVGVDATQAGVPYHCLATDMIGPNNSITATVRSPDILVYICELRISIGTRYKQFYRKSHACF